MYNQTRQKWRNGVMVTWWVSKRKLFREGRFERPLEYERKLLFHISLWLSAEETSKIKFTSSVLYHYLPWWEWQLIFCISKVQIACECLCNGCVGFLCNLSKRSDLLSCNLKNLNVLRARKQHKCQRQSSFYLGKVCLHFTRTKDHGGKEKSYLAISSHQ